MTENNENVNIGTTQNIPKDISNVRVVSKEQLVDAVAELVADDMRFITMTGFDRGETREVLYHFEKEFDMLHLQVTIGKDEELPSISSVCLCAFLSENEVKELFGINITNIAIDYNGRLLIAENCPATPMLKSVNKSENPAIRVIQTRSAMPKENGGESVN